MTRHAPADWETEDNIKSVASIPPEVLPEGPARRALARMAFRGYDLRAYASGGETYGTWCIWSGELADARAARGHDGRVALATWATDWRPLMREIVDHLIAAGDASALTLAIGLDDEVQEDTTRA